MKLTITLLLCSFALGCGYGSGYNSMTGGGAPSLSQLSPSSTTAGSGGFSMTVTGTNFTAGSIVYWGTTPLTTSTTYNSTTQLTAAITAAMVANQGSVSVYVHSAGGNSNSMMFTIN
jgi:hypothetical protein